MAIQGFSLSPQQEHLWLLAGQQPHAYRVQGTIEALGALDATILKGALGDVVRRHEILRTTFKRLPGMKIPVQVIADDAPPQIVEQDLAALQPESQAEAIAEILQRERQRQLDLASDPALSVAILTLAADRHLILLSLSALHADIATLARLVAEIGECYAARLGRATPDDEVVQYADIAEWQNSLLESEETEAGRAYWSKQPIADRLSLRLAFEQPSDAAEFEPQQLSAALDPALVAQVRAVARDHDCSTAAVLLACWQTLIWRLTDQSDLLVGTAFDGRKYVELQGVLGLLTKYLPLHSQLSAQMAFGDLVRQAKSALLEAYRGQEFFVWALLADQLPHDHAAFFPLAFEFVEHTEAVPAADLSLRLQSHDACVERFTLKLACVERDDTLVATLHYDAAVLAQPDIRRVLDEFQVLLGSAVATPDAPIAALNLLSPVERRQLVVEFNATQDQEPTAASLHQLVERQAERTPDATAVVFEDRSLSYRELNARANQLARYLRRLGIGVDHEQRGDPLVGLCVERSPEMLIGMLAILKAGAAYLPLDPAYPAERLRLMLDDAQASVVLTQSHLDVPETAARTICLDSDWAAITEESAEDLDVQPDGDSLAYVIYTSGSTGTPKGVLVSHRNAVHSTQARLRFYTTPVTSFLLLPSFAFDSSVAVIFGTLCQGGALVLTRTDQQRDPGQLAGLVATHQVSHWLSIPSLYLYLLEQAETDQLGSLRTVIVAGEECSADLVARHRRQLPGVALFNEYGPTEGTVWSAVYDTGDYSGRGLVPIGRPISNATIYLLDPLLQPVPIGAAGELYIGGAGVARGYLKRPALTATRFVPDPFGENPGARLYHTGDLGRWLSNGSIEFLGRGDQQVKIRGFRIELGEIEAALMQHPGVREAAVLAREARPAGAPGAKRLVAYVVEEPRTQNLEPRIGEQRSTESSPSPVATEAEARRGSGEGVAKRVPSGCVRATSEGLRAFLAERLPDYMLPQVFVMLETLPRTATGKLDRAALPAPGEEPSATKTPFVAPRVPVEDVLAAIWAELLKVERVGVYDNFFELGGHSILATQLAARVRQALQVEIQLPRLFESPTIASLAKHVEQARQSAHGWQFPPLEAVPRDGALPLSFAQQRLWFRDQLTPGSAAFNNPAAIRLVGQLNIPALEHTFSEIVRRHEVLRTRYQVVDERPVQVITPPRPFTFEHIDLSALPAAEQEAEVKRLSTTLAQQPFDLASDELLLHGTLLHLAPQEHVLVMVQHHIASDAWSMGVILGEIAALYAASCTDKPSPLPELPIQYADFAVWEQQWLEGPVREAQLSYWKSQLANLPMLKLPLDRPRPPVQGDRGRFQYLELPASLLHDLKALSAEADTTLFMVLLAAFNVLLRHHSGQTDIVIGTDVANRTTVETERLLGFFVNQVVLRTDVSGDPSFRELLDRVRAVTLAAYEHQTLPFELLVEALQPKRSLSHHPLFQVLFGFDNTPISSLEVQGLALTDLKLNNGSAVHDLSLIWSITEQGTLLGQFRYNTDVFDAATITQLGEQLEHLLHQIVAQPAVALGALDESLAAMIQQQRLTYAEERKQQRREQLRQASRQTEQASAAQEDG